MSMENLGNAREGTIEKITSAALRYKDRIFIGTTHMDAYESLRETFPDDDERYFRIEITEGFMTSKGRFVDRAEAGKIAEQAAQIKLGYEGDGPIGSEHLKS